jgi:dihydrofolate reductase
LSANSEADKLPQIVLVVAAADNDVIGAGGKLPWHLRSDLQHFRVLTAGKPVVMGRKTYLSIGRPLPGRTNIVVSRDPAFTAPGLLVAPTLEAALTSARGDALRRGSDIMVIGGAEIFAQLLPAVTRLELTRVHLRPHGDVLLPPIEWSQWQETARRDLPQGPHDDAGFTVLTYRRVVQQ